MHRSQPCRCRCGCLLARVSVPVTVRFDSPDKGVEIRCRRCKTHAVLVPTPADPEPADEALRAAE